MLESLYGETNEKMDKSLVSLNNELKRVRTGRASTTLLDGIRIDYYGTLTALDQVASLSVPESRLLIIKPWDASIIKEIEKAILKSDLGLTPSNDGKLIRLPIPPLTEESRKKLVKVVHKICEEYKVTVRNIRRDSNNMAKALKKAGDITEDDVFKSQDEIQKITDKNIKIINNIYSEKEEEVLTF